MNIGIDGRASQWYRGTGIGTYTYQLINYVNKVDFLNNYMIFMPKNSKYDINFNSNFSIANITENCKDNFWDEVNIPNILKSNEVDLYHVPQNGIGSPEEKKCPLVITLHDVIPYRMPKTTSEGYLKLFEEKLPDIVSMCDGIITVSNFSKEDIVKTFNFPREKIFVTYLASEDIYRPIDKLISRKIVKNFYGIDNDFVLYVGGFSPRKNIVGLIESFSKVIAHYKKNIKLVIAGKKGKSYEIYKKRCEELHINDKVIFPGFIPIDHMPYFYNAAKLFVYPSFYEGFGLPPLEAMACGVPVVASNLTSIPEVVKDAALHIDPNDIDNLFYSISKGLMDDKLREKLILKGLIRSSELTWKSTARDTLIAYNKIVNS